jgi:hypothetical protein
MITFQFLYFQFDFSESEESFFCSIWFIFFQLSTTFMTIPQFNQTLMWSDLWYLILRRRKKRIRTFFFSAK